MTSAQRKKLARDLLAVLIPLYLARKQRAYDEIGRADAPVMSKAQKIALLQFIAARVEKIDTGIDTRLAAARAQPLEGVSDADAIDQAGQEIRDYNARTLSRFLGNTASQMGYTDGYTDVNPLTGERPADAVLWTWEQQTNFEDDCTEAADASPAPLDTLLAITGGMPPAHPNCECVLWVAEP